MNNEVEYIRAIFRDRNFSELYRTQSTVINEMLMIDNPQDFEDFLSGENNIDEAAFWLFYSAVHGESLLIGGYEEDVSEKITNFLKRKLPENVFSLIRDHLRNIHVDIDAENNLEEIIGFCNRHLSDTDYSLCLDFDDTYCEGVYFLRIALKNFQNRSI